MIGRKEGSDGALAFVKLYFDKESGLLARGRHATGRKSRTEQREGKSVCPAAEPGQASLAKDHQKDGGSPIGRVGRQEW